MTVGRSRSKWGFLLAEAVLIVLSILLAFAIDAYWDGRQEEARRLELLHALRSDFAATAMALDKALEKAMADVARTGGYLDVVFDNRTVSRDSLVYLLDGVGEITFFEPSAASYRTALSTGSLDLIRNPVLLEAFSEFDLALDKYDQHLGLSGEMFYLGAVHDLRRALGGYMVPLPDRGKVPGPEHRRNVVPADFDLRSAPAVAAAEAVYWAHVNVLDALLRMDESAEKIVAELDRMHQ
jgi:hypothetical protein